MLVIVCVCRPFPQLEKNDIRVLVFKDSDGKGRTLLFDSKAVVNSDKKVSSLHPQSCQASILPPTSMIQYILDPILSSLHVVQRYSNIINHGVSRFKFFSVVWHKVIRLDMA